VGWYNLMLFVAQESREGLIVRDVIKYSAYIVDLIVVRWDGIMATILLKSKSHSISITGPL